MNREHARRFREIQPTDGVDFDGIAAEVKDFFSEVGLETESSDSRHLARAVAGGADYFATRDENPPSAI